MLKFLEKKTEPKTETKIKVKKEISSAHKKKIIVGIICIAAALAISIVLVPKVVESTTSTHDIVVMKSNVKSGMKITENDVMTQKIKDETVAAAFVSSTKDIVGKYAAVDLSKGDYILPSKLWEENKSSIYTRIDEGYLTMSVSFNSFAASMSNGIQKGDIVSIFGILNSQNASEETEFYEPLTVLRDELRYVEVVDVSNEKKGQQIDNTVPPSKDEDALQLSTVTLLVTEQQAKCLVDFEHAGYLHLALVYRGDEEIADTYVQEQWEYIEEQKQLQEEALLESTDDTSSEFEEVV